MEINEKISVVIVNFNAGTGLVDTVRAAIVDAHEVIVVDNNSSDDSLQFLESEFGRDPKLRIIRNPTNQGFAKACNRGFGDASGEFVLFLNPDCELEKGAMACLLEAIQADAEVGMVGGLLLNPDGSEQAGGRRAVPTPWRSFVRAFGLTRLAKRWPKLFYDFHLHEEPLPDHPIAVEAISGACMLARRQAMQEVGLLDEEYFMHCEDLDWCIRFWRGKWKILFVPGALMLHHKGVCSRSRPIFVEWNKHKGMMRFYRKFFRHQYPGAIMWLVVAGVWLRFCLVLSYLTVRRVIRMSGLVEAEAATSPMPEVITEPRDIRSGRKTAMAESLGFPSRVGSQKNRVGLLGATSFVGSCLLPLLSEAGWQVTAFSRRAIGPTGDGVMWRQLPQSTMALSTPIPEGKGNLPYWISVAPISVLPDYFGLLDTHGARRVVVLSSTSRFTKNDSSDPQEQELSLRFAEAEARLQSWAESRGVDWVILRPTLIYGLGRDKNISEIALLIRRFGFFPLFGKACGLRQPIHAADVAADCLAALQAPRAANRAYNISGGETLAYREMVSRVFSLLGRRPRLLTVPLWAFYLALKGLHRVPRYRHWTAAMAERMNRDLVFDHTEAVRDLGSMHRPFVLTEEDLPK